MNQTPEIKRILYARTKLCRNGPDCKEQNCSYAHSENELQVPLCIFREQCFYHRKGSCKYRHPSNDDPDLQTLNKLCEKTSITSEVEAAINILNNKSEYCAMTIEFPQYLLAPLLELNRAFLQDYSLPFEIKRSNNS